MRTYKRINEDYLDSIDRNEYTDELSINLDANVNLLLNGQVPNIDFNVISEPIYKVYDKDALKCIIKVCIETYGKNCSLNWIDVSRIKDMSNLFFYSEFNGDISAWNVSSVTNMINMFGGSEFNDDISQWDVSSVTNMNFMFYDSKFNGDISKWDVSSVMNMGYMFNCSEFNGDISQWDVSNVENMDRIFDKCPIESQPEKQPKFNQ